MSDLLATQISVFSCVSRNTINNYFKIFRETIFNFLEKDAK
ncbi:MAG: hypothetical protein PHY80_04140 [Rickettsiales bacterium]|nr:hypothetical protein [Rickettsiales bacterium]